jgi:hypothetical protein
LKRLAAALLICSCQGEAVSSPTTDAAQTSDTASACDEIPGNLVSNPSFEEGVGGWNNSEAISGGAEHCGKWAKVTTTNPWQHSSFRVPIDGKAGETYEFGASVQRLDDIASVDVFLLTPTSMPETHVDKNLPTKGTWSRATGTLKLTADVTSVTIGVGANAAALRTVGIDRGWVGKK